MYFPKSIFFCFFFLINIIRLQGQNWYQLANDIYGEAENDYSGYSIGLSADGQTVAIGAFGNQDQGFQAGHVRVFSLQDAGWIQLGEDIEGSVAREFFGQSLSLSGDGLKLAASGLVNVNDSIGFVRVFSYDGNDWIQSGQDLVPFSIAQKHLCK